MDYLGPQQVDLLLERLIDLTNRGTITWKPISQGHEYAFFWKSGKFGYIIRSRDDDDFAPYVLSVVTLDDGDGLKTLQEVETTEFTQQWNSQLERLYEVVKRRTLNIEAVASEIFDELDALDRSKPATD